MADAFLRLVAEHIHKNYEDKLENLCIVLPNKRASVFLKKHLAKTYGKTTWLPAMHSAEEFIGMLSGLQVLDEVDLICHLYNSYKVCYGDAAEPFESFVRWGQLILQDFNEIDRYLADPRQLYGNLKEIKQIENWSLSAEELTSHQSDYLKFMESLQGIYEHYTSFLLSNKLAYQGLTCRVAAQTFAENEYVAERSKILFCGFNALNAAEKKIFTSLVNIGKAEMLWDADRYYLDDEKQEAGFFMRKNLKTMGGKQPLFISDNFRNPKDVEIISVPRQMGQAQVLRQKLDALVAAGTNMEQVAVVLANEKLLWPVLSLLPDQIENVNVTMGYPMRFTSTFGLAEQLVQIHLGFERQTGKEKTIYHKDLVALLRQPLFVVFLQSEAPLLNPRRIIRETAMRNLSFLNQARLAEIIDSPSALLSTLLRPFPTVHELCDGISAVLTRCAEFIRLKPKGQKDVLELEFLFELMRSFNRLKDIVSSQPEFSNVQAFKQLFHQVTGNASISFSGEPLTGLQVMGVLETRCLDFEHVIILSANEGILPSGRSQNSFIPNDLKSVFGLPLYSEKDAIYAYHFYRLLQRAQQVTLICDSETDTFGKGEKSRFVTQLQMELPAYSPEANIRSTVATYTELPPAAEGAIIIKRTEKTLQAVLDKATNAEKYGGISPSALASYKNCGLQFYFRYGAGLKETEEVEESAEAGTFGSILHLSLETLYKNYIGQVIQRTSLVEKLELVDEVVRESFMFFFGGAQPMGKSLLQEDVIRVYVRKLLNRDLRLIERLNANSETLALLYLEHEFTAPLKTLINGDSCTVYIKGKIDRVDRHGETVRLIDYKSSVNSADCFTFDGLDVLFADTNYNKQLQLIVYAWLLYTTGIAKAEQLCPCIIPFKVFAEEPKYILGPDKKPLRLSEEFFREFESALQSYISDIFNGENSFVQTADEEVCGFCAYNVICNRAQ
jgi:ATP-dependent helicase/nuclease subunit B